MKKLHEDLNTKTFAELSEIIEEYSKSNNIDLVIGKMEVVYLVDKFEITEQILDALRTKDLFYEEVTEVIEEKTEEKTEESL